jgi:hypothetical protein
MRHFLCGGAARQTEHDNVANRHVAELKLLPGVSPTLAE